MKPLTERKFMKDGMSLVGEFTQKRKVYLKKNTRWMKVWMSKVHHY